MRIIGHHGDMQRPLRMVAVALLTLGLVPAARASTSTTPVVVIDGRGWGHGVGMAQDGALALGRAGKSTAEILGTFYPGTALGQVSGSVRVVVTEPTGGSVLIAFPSGGELRSPASGTQRPGFPVRVGAGGRARVRFTGSRYEVIGGTPASGWQGASAATAATASSPGTAGTASGTTTTLLPTPAPAPAPTTTTTTAPGARPKPKPSPSTTEPAPSPPAGPSSPTPVWAVPASGGLLDLPERAHRYRGVAEATASGGTFRLVNQVDVEQYLRGMGEVRDSSWPAAGLEAQAIAARTYALRTMAAGGELCDTQRCQVYLGVEAEYAAMDTAVAHTAGQVLTYGGRYALAVYSANAGGHLATVTEGFGTPGTDYPYLRAAPYLTNDPLPWDVEVALADVAARLSYPGALSGLRLTATGPSGRALSVRLDGDHGSQEVSGLVFADALGLRSTLFTLSAADRAVAPPPPPLGGRSIQLTPELIERIKVRGYTPTTTSPPVAGAEAAFAPARKATAGSGRLPWVITALVACGEVAAGLAWHRRRAPS